MIVEAPRKTARPLAYLVWVILLSVPFWLWGIVWPVQQLPLGLPISAGMIVCPALAASILTWQELGTSGVLQLWRRILDVRRIKSWRWLVASLLFMPAAMMLTYGVIRLVGVPLPAGIRIALVTTLIIFAAYFIGAIPEEIGWTAYATGPLQRRYGVLVAGLLIGAVWAAWHFVPWWIGQGSSRRVPFAGQILSGALAMTAQVGRSIGGYRIDASPRR